MKLIAFGASLREGSLNRNLAALASDALRAQGAEVDLHDFSDFDVPLFTDSVPGAPLPGGAETLKKLIESSQGLVISLPEYNWSYPGHLKNLIDWISRARPVPLAGKSCLLLSASTSAMGGIRGLLHFRQPLEALGMFVYPKMFTLANATQEFDSTGKFRDAIQQKRLETLAVDFVTFARNLS